MINNFQAIRDLLTFGDEDKFYFIQIFKRRKDNPDMKKDMVIIDNYFVYELEHFNGLEEKIIKQCIDWLRVNPGPVITSNHKVAAPDRESMKSNMEELIHHFKLFTEGFHVPEGEAYAAVEHPKGEFGIYIVSDGANKPYRLKIRPPGFSHLAAMDEMSRGHMIADAVAVIGTMDIVFGEIDR